MKTYESALANMHRLLSSGEVTQAGRMHGRLAKTQRRHVLAVLEAFRAAGWVAGTDQRLEWRGPDYLGVVRSFGGDATTYMAVHLRLWRARGRATEYPCSDCRRPAHQWAYDHLDPEEVYGSTKSGRSDSRPYSLKLEHYRPLCRSCHVRLDRSGATMTP